MKKMLLCLVVFVLSSSVWAAQCICPPRAEDARCLVYCGHLSCSVYVADAAYVTGGSCQFRRGFHCCSQAGSGLRSTEGAETALDMEVQFREVRGQGQGRGPVFDWTISGTEVVRVINGQEAGRGTFLSTELEGYLGSLELDTGEVLLVDLWGNLELIATPPAQEAVCDGGTPQVCCTKVISQGGKKCRWHCTDGSVRRCVAPRP